MVVLVAEVLAVVLLEVSAAVSVVVVSLVEVPGNDPGKRARAADAAARDRDQTGIDRTA